MRSRITRRVMRCQKDSLSSGFSGAEDCPASLLSHVVTFPSSAMLAMLAVVSCVRLILLRLVSFSISSNNTFDCSILHCSIRSILTRSTCASLPSSTASNLLCTLDLLLWWPAAVFSGLYCSNCHSCSWTGELEAGKEPSPSCVGSIVSPLCSTRREL